MVKSLLASSTVIVPRLMGSKEEMTEGGSSGFGSGVLAPLMDEWVLLAGPSGRDARLRRVAIGADKAIEFTVLRGGDSGRVGVSWTAEGGEVSSRHD
jgi:hypothetical protein